MSRSLILSFALVCASPCTAAPIVTATATGSPGDWAINVSLTNTLTTTLPDVEGFRLNTFGLAVGVHAVIATPVDLYEWREMSGLDPHFGNYYVMACLFNCNLVHYGGSTTHYDNWWDGFGTGPGLTTSGFVVRQTSLTPQPVPWFTFGYSRDSLAVYAGTDNLYLKTNPLFEGIVTPRLVTSAAVEAPEPFSGLLLGLGLLGTRLIPRRFRVFVAQH